MNGLDWIIVATGFFCIGRGLLRGAISQLFGIAGVLGGFFTASHFYTALAAQLSQAFPGLPAPPILSFMLLFFLTWFCIGVVGFWLAGLFRRTGLGFIDRLWGGGVGAGKALVLVVILISFFTFFLSPRSDLLAQSALTPYVQEAARFLIKATPVRVQTLFEEKRKAFMFYWLDRHEPVVKPKAPGSKEAKNR